MFDKLLDDDFHRKVTKDRSKRSFHGRILSICAILLMFMVFIGGLWDFQSTHIRTNTDIYTKADSLIRIDFNITFTDLPCEFATIDVIDVLGTRKENVTENIDKWQVDRSGNRRAYDGRNMETKDIMQYAHHVAQAVQAVQLNDTSYRQWLDDHEYVFANFYVPWSIWCQKLEPVWDALAERMESDQVPIFKHGEFQSPDYKYERSVNAFTDYIHSKLPADEQAALLDPKQRHERLPIQKTAYPGCLLAGHLLVNRVPGNIHIKARSEHQYLNAAMANLSHVVNHFSFGDPHAKDIQPRIEESLSGESTKRMDGSAYLTEKFHQSYHHFIKVVPTQEELGSRYM